MLVHFILLGVMYRYEVKVLERLASEEQTEGLVGSKIPREL